MHTTCLTFFWVPMKQDVNKSNKKNHCSHRAHVVLIASAAVQRVAQDQQLHHLLGTVRNANHQLLT